MMTGLRKSIVQQKKDLGLAVTEGKDSMTFEAYKLTCQLLLKESKQEHLFALAWLTIQWNLISRSEATETISFKQIFWDADHVKIYFAKHKGDQAGTNKDEPRHMYSNPIIPEICPIRALSAYLLCCPDVVTEGGRIFPGSDQRSRFNRIFHATVNRNSELYLAAGIDPQEIGTHSIRKGAATYCCAGVHPGPPVVSVCLRAGWSLGRVKKRYLKYEVAGDELVGRTLTGIPPTSSEFGISPVFYKNSHESYVFSDSLLKAIFPQHPESIKKFLQVCLASSLYHEEFTLSSIDNNHSPFHTSNFIRIAALYPNRKKFVTTSLPWENKPGCPALTGIPIHCSILNKLMEIHQMQKDLPSSMVAKFVEALDNRMIGDAGSILAKKVMDRVNEIGDDINKKVQSQFNDGSYNQGNTHTQQTQSIVARTMLREENATPSENEPRLLFPDEGIFVHFWNDRQRTVPKDFKFPKQMCNTQISALAKYLA